MNQTWLPILKVQSILQVESFIVCWLLIPLSFLLYKIFLTKISDKRHANLKNRFINTSSYLFFSSLTTPIFYYLSLNAYKFASAAILYQFSSILGLISLILGVIAAIKICQIYVYLYLFLMNMSVGVPRLIANMITLLVVTFVFCWLGSYLFGINLTTMIATSAVFSLILGLALQDTLGNFFSGLALQIDQPFHIGDWIEIHSSSEKWTGQVLEINWRATTLTGFSDEVIVIPNRVIAQNQLINFSLHPKAARIGQLFRFPFEADIDLIKKILIQSCADFPEILKDPEPRALIIETQDSWISVKLLYSLSDYGLKFRLSDKLIQKVLKQLKEHNIKLAHQVLDIQMPQK